MGLNCHFVSRFLTQPWEHGQRMLWYYDFSDGSLKSCSSRSLFAATDANSAHVEARLNAFVETPIAAARTGLWAGTSEVSPSLEWPLFRALALLLLLQPFRASTSPDGPQTLEETLVRPDAEIDGLAHAIGSRYRLIRVTIGSHSRLLYPSDGWFPLVAEPTEGPCPFAIAIPLSPQHAFIGVPGTVTPQQTEVWTMNGAGFVANYSVGHRSRQIVVHPDVVSSLSTSAIAEGIREARDGVVRAIGLCRSLAEIVRRMDTVFST